MRTLVVCALVVAACATRPNPFSVDDRALDAATLEDHGDAASETDLGQTRVDAALVPVDESPPGRGRKNRRSWRR